MELIIEIGLPLQAVVICLVAEAFFSGSEIAVVSADRNQLRHDAAKGSHGAALALRMLEKPEWLLATTLVGTNIAVVTNTTLVADVMIRLWGPSGALTAVVLAAPLIWIFGEIVPKSVFQQRANAITPRAVYLLRAASIVFFPILVVFTFLSRLFTMLVGGTRQNPFTLREEIVNMMELPAGDGDIDPDEMTMIRRLFNFSETTAYEVMLPLIDVVAIDRQATCGQALRLAAESAHVRLPVFDERIDRIVGLLNTLELLGAAPEDPIEVHLRPVRYVPASTSIKDLLLDLREDGDRMGVVVDEFGGAQGIVTTEDIMEVVVDDMEDEYDVQAKPAQWIRKFGDRRYLVSGRIPLETLMHELGIETPLGNYTTLAGFLLERVREIPPVGTVIEVKDVTFTISRGTPQAVQEIEIRC